MVNEIGLKFKLVKSNSCSSRLELAGTGLEKNVGGLHSAVDEMRNIVHGQQQRRQLHDEHEEDEKFHEDLEHEETVKDMIHKLETKNSHKTAAPTKPRIIESRCIEKIQPTSTASVKESNGKVTINNQASSFIAPSILSNIDPKNDYEEYVTVNNHISISSKTSEPNNPTILMMHENGVIGNKSSSSENINGEHYGNGNDKIQATTKPKVVRNKNVDLALLAAVNKKKEIGKNPKGFNGRDNEIFSSSSSTSASAQNDSHNEHENSIAFIKTSRNNLCKMQSVDMVKHQDKMNISHHAKSHHHQQQQQKQESSEASSSSDAAYIKTSVEKLNSTSSANVGMASTSSTNKIEEKPVKMVNWGTVGVFSKEYIANDNRIVNQQVKVYDDMEFEEFEVAGEHYDSLNSK